MAELNDNEANHPEVVVPPECRPPEGGKIDGRGAKPGNFNALKHGGRARQERVGFVMAQLGAKDRSAYVHCRTIRKAVEEILLDKQAGRITRYQDARLQTLLRLEMSCRTVERSAREDSDMGPGDRAKLRKLVCDWSLQRDAILLELIGDGDAGPGGEGGGGAAADAWAMVGEGDPSEPKE